MEDNPHLHKECLNCGAKLPEGAIYCPNCAQKVTTGKVSIKDFFFEFLDTLFSLDSRIWRTLRDIWIPGKLTSEYFKGKHKTYMHPLRLFFIMGLIHFAIISYRTNDMVRDSLSKGPEFIKKEQIQKKYFQKIDSLSQNIENSFEDPEVSMAFDSLRAVAQTGIDTFTNENNVIFSGVETENGEEVEIPFTEYYKYSYEELKEKYKVTGFLSQVYLKQQHRAANDPEKMYNSVMANMIWMVLLMMPAVALILKLLYVRRKMYFVEHLVFSYHFHAFAFLITAPFYLFLPEDAFGNILIPFIVILVYLFIMMKRFYKQGGFRTFLKWFLLLNSYAIMVTSFFLLTLIASFFMF